MKKFGILIVLALIGGGVWVYMKKPELIDDIKNKVEKAISGSGWRELKDYRADFVKAKLTEGEETAGYVRDFKDEMASLNFTDENDGKLTLVHLNSTPQALFLEFKEDSADGVAVYAKDLFGQLFEGEPDFSKPGSISSEVAQAEWTNKSGTVIFDVMQKGIEKATPIEDLPQEIKDSIAATKKLINEKIDLESEYDKLFLEKHHCFDKARFKEITARIEAVKARAAELTEEYKALKAKIPQAYILKLQADLEPESMK